MAPQARIVHRTGERLRIKLSPRPRDLGLYVALYEDLRRVPGVAEVQVNPITGSALLHFDRGDGERVLEAIAHSGLFSLTE